MQSVKHILIYCMYEHICTSCTILEQEQLLNLMARNKVICHMRLFHAKDVNLIYVTCRVGQWLVDTYRVGRLALS